MNDRNYNTERVDESDAIFNALVETISSGSKKAEIMECLLHGGEITEEMIVSSKTEALVLENIGDILGILGDEQSSGRTNLYAALKVKDQAAA